MNRPTRKYITPAGRTATPAHLIVMDTETISTPGRDSGEVLERWRLGVLISCRRVRGDWVRRDVLHFTDPHELWDWIAANTCRKRPAWLFGHNIGFDLTVSEFWARLDMGEWAIADKWKTPSTKKGQRGGKPRPWRGSLIVADPPTFLSLRSQTGSLRIVDTFNYFRSSLAELGHAVGLEQIPAPARSDSGADWFARCERDCEILERTLKRWFERWETMDCGPWKSTAASLAWSAWTKTIDRKAVAADHDPVNIDMSRTAYYGGRVECRWIGAVAPPHRAMMPLALAGMPARPDRPRGPIYVLDCKSMYPSLMRSNFFPVRFIGSTQENTLGSLRARSQVDLPIARVLIDSSAVAYPRRLNDRFQHVCGRFWTTLPGPELALAVQRGHVAAVGRVAWYKPGDVFTAFVNQWLNARDECRSAVPPDPAGALFCKMIVNSLSGKFAQRKHVWEDRPGETPLLRFGEWRGNRDGKSVRYRAIAGNVQEFTGFAEHSDSVPAISAYITSYGRAMLSMLLERVPTRSVLYMDTDSLWVTNDGLQALELAGAVRVGQVGYLELRDVHEWAIIYGPKVYRTPTGMTCAGLKKDARPVLAGQWEQKIWQRLGDYLMGLQEPAVSVRAGLFGLPGVQAGSGMLREEWATPPTVCNPGTEPF